MVLHCNNLATQSFSLLQEQCKALSIDSSFELLADESRDLSQAEKKITVVKIEQIHKMTTMVTQYEDF